MTSVCAYAADKKQEEQPGTGRWGVRRVRYAAGFTFFPRRRNDASGSY